MAYDITTSGNYIFIVNTETNEEYEAKKSDVLFRRNKVDSEHVNILGVAQLDETLSIHYSKILVDGSPVANMGALKHWYSENTAGFKFATSLSAIDVASIVLNMAEDLPVSTAQALINASKADTAYVENLSFGINWIEPLNFATIVGNSATVPPSPADGDGYVIKAGGLVGLWSGFAVNDLVQWQHDTWVLIKSLEVGDRLGVNFKNITTPTGSFSGKNYQIATVTSLAGDATFSFVEPSAGDGVYVQSGSSLYNGVSFAYAENLAKWVQLSANTGVVFGSDFRLVGNTVFLNNISTSPLDYNSSTKIPVWQAISQYFSDVKIKEILGITTLSGSNTGDETVTSLKGKLGITVLSGDNTGDETASTIRTKLGITTLSGSNTGDETTSTIQTKRPIKTVNSLSLEGSGDIDIKMEKGVSATNSVLTVTGTAYQPLVGITYTVRRIGNARIKFDCSRLTSASQLCYIRIELNGVVIKHGSLKTLSNKRHNFSLETNNIEVVVGDVIRITANAGTSASTVHTIYNATLIVEIIPETAVL